MIISENCAERIITAVGIELQSKEAQKFGIIVCLELAWQWYRSALAFSSNQPQKHLLSSLNSARNTAKRLEQLLAQENVWQALFAPSPSDESVRCAISQLVAVIDSRLVEEEDEEGPRTAYQRSVRHQHL